MECWGWRRSHNWVEFWIRIGIFQEKRETRKRIIYDEIEGLKRVEWGRWDGTKTDSFTAIWGRSSNNCGTALNDYLCLIIELNRKIINIEANFGLMVVCECFLCEEMTPNDLLSKKPLFLMVWEVSCSFASGLSSKFTFQLCLWSQLLIFYLKCFSHEG